MTNFSKIVIKKIFESKTRFVLMVVNLSLGIFLFSFIITIGLNLSKNNKLMLDSISYYKQIQINTINFDLKRINDFKRNKNITKIQIELNSEFIIKSIEDKKIDNGIFVSQIESTNDLIFNKNKLLNGRILKSDNEIMVSHQYLESLSIDSHYIIGKKVILSNGKMEIERIIVGTYDRELGDVFLPYIFMFNFSEDNIINQILLEVDSIYNVKEVMDFINKLGFSQNNYYEEIREIISFSSILIISFVFIGALILLSCASIISTSLKVSIKVKYPFISLLKAFGYSNKKLSLIIYLELIILLFLSIFIGNVMCGLALLIIPIFMNNEIFHNIKYINVLSFSNIAILSSIVFSILIMYIISIKPVLMIKKCDVIHLLKEVEQ